MMKNVINSVSILFCLVSSLSTLQAMTYTRKPMINSAWSDVGSWDANGVPPSTIGASDIVITGDNNIYLDVNITNNGIIEISDGSASFFQINAGVTLTNNNIIRTASGSNGSTLAIEGILTNTVTGSITPQNDANTFTLEIGGVFNNSGSLSLSNCQLTLLSPMTNNGTITITGGSGIIISAAFTNNSTITNAGGIIINNASITNSGTVTNDGVYSGTGSYSGSLFTNTSDGGIGTGSIVDCLSFANGFTNEGQFVIVLKGATTACTDYSRINVTGTATLGGDFFLTTINPFQYTVGDVYDVLTATQINGQFATTSFDLGIGPGGIGPYANVYYLPVTGTKTSVRIKIENAAVLPVELLKFTATTEGAKNHLTWATASETNNKGFDIERSRDGETFQTIGTVKAIGKAGNYNFIDAEPVNGTNYYRLRQIDFDGTATLSKVVSVTTKGDKHLKVYPTLVSNGFLTVDTEGRDYAIYNIFGQQVQSGKTTQRLDVSALAKGAYILKVGTEQAKFVKQ
jgi:hypothetical protein